VAELVSRRERHGRPEIRVRPGTVVAGPASGGGLGHGERWGLGPRQVAAASRAHDERQLLRPEASNACGEGWRQLRTAVLVVCGGRSAEGKSRSISCVMCKFVLFSSNDLVFLFFSHQSWEE